ncbi:hypothetical protein C8R45DRAFT_1031939 [Mycena sanguinolenta]|nr:hypothetical protein C8R45DRAFT_1031939 [Mycena sanguinolenta]
MYFCTAAMWSLTLRPSLLRSNGASILSDILRSLTDPSRIHRFLHGKALGESKVARHTLQILACSPKCDFLVISRRPSNRLSLVSFEPSSTVASLSDM